jgi:hypothetical protein
MGMLAALGFPVLGSSAALAAVSGPILLSAEEGPPLQGSAGLGAGLNQAAAGGEAIVAVGSDGKIFRSTDGFTWGGLCATQ